MRITSAGSKGQLLSDITYLLVKYPKINKNIFQRFDLLVACRRLTRFSDIFLLNWLLTSNKYGHNIAYRIFFYRI